MNNEWQPIISLGAEGGIITLYGRELHPGQWVFSKSVSEIHNSETNQATAGFLNQANELDSWEKALEILEPFHWTVLTPLKIHPEFRKQVWKAFQKKYKKKNDGLYKSYILEQWAKICFPDFHENAVTLASWLHKSTYTTVLTGAGMSTESNIPDFRSKEGWWNNFDPRIVATTEALQKNYDLFHDFYSFRINRLKQCTPHQGHEILASWEQKGLIQAISTQNVDGFHTAAGNRNVHELHGSIHKIRCADCSKSASKENFLNKNTCSYCGGKLRPGVVLFGEMLPEESWKASYSHIRKSDLVIVIGTSLEVYPASQLPQMTKGKTAYINTEIGAKCSEFDLNIQGKAGEVLKQVNELL